MTPKKKPIAFAAAPAFEFRIKVDVHAAADLERIDDHAAVTAILRQAARLKTEPLQQGKPLKKALKGYRSVQVTGQDYQIVYRVIKEAEEVVIASVSEYINSKTKADASTDDRLS